MNEHYHKDRMIQCHEAVLTNSRILQLQKEIYHDLEARERVDDSTIEIEKRIVEIDYLTRNIIKSYGFSESYFGIKKIEK